MRASRPASDRPALSRDQVVDAAVELLRRDGIESLSLRRVAGDLGVTAMALYRHVEDVNDLVVAILDRGFSVFRDRLRAAAPADDPRQAVVSTAAAFWDFSTDHGTYFELMFLTRRLPGGLDDRRAVERITAESFDILVERVEAARKAGAIRSGHPRETAGELLALAVGTVALHRTGNLGWPDDRARERFLRRIRAALDRVDPAP